MANKTENLNLTLPLGSDRPDINVLNQNFERIDSAHGQEREERINADVDLAAAIQVESDRAKSRENDIDSALNNEVSRAKSAESANATAISNETSRAANAETELEQAISRESSRAQEAEKANADSLAAHSSNHSNPHAVTKEQVGLGNVPNVTTNDQTPSYTEASTLSALTNGEKLSIAFGKIAKAISSLISHLANTSNPHKVTKSQVGLGNVDNTSDSNKPVSTAQQSAIDLAYANSNAYTDQKISELINGAPTTLDTLGEIASAMAEHEDVVTALNEAIGTKANQTELDTHTGNDTIHITSKERTNWNDANSKKHTHGNQSILDAITQTLIDSWNAAYSHITDTVKHITAAERISWNAAKTHADSAHAPSDAQANVIETVKVNGTALTPSSKSVNIPVPAKTSDLTNDSGFITSKDIDTSQNHTHSNKGVLDKIAQAMLDKLDGIEAGANAYTHPTHTARSSGLYKITVDGNGHVVDVEAVTKNDITGLGIPGTDTNTWRGIQDNLSSDSSSDSLSAKQGKVLKGLVDGKAASSHTHNSVIDIGNGSSATTFAYSKAGLGYSDYTWLAGWNGYELRAVNKSHFAASGHTHDDRYYTESEIDTKLSGKSNTNHTHNYIVSRGNLNPQTGRTQNYGDVYSYNTTGANSGAPTTYSSIIGFGRGAAGTVEICGEWTSGRGLWARALRDYEDSWYDWQRIYTDNYHPQAGNADTLDGYHASSFCLTNDSRLSNARPASDVYDWAKASSKPSYSWSEITNKPAEEKFTEVSGGYVYWKLRNNTITVVIDIKNTVYRHDQVIYTLPSGKRPFTWMSVNNVYNDPYGYVAINTEGQIKYQNNTTTTDWIHAVFTYVI